MNWHRGYEAFEQKAKARLEFDDLAGFKLRKPLAETGDLDGFLGRLSDHYLKASGGERAGIRERFRDPDAQWYLREYLQRMTPTIEGKFAEIRLRLTLAAASIADQRPEPRDFLYDLGYIYRAAQRAGITNPMPYFREAGEISSEAGAESTAELMRTFDRTRVCRELQWLTARPASSLSDGSARTPAVARRSFSD
jgi:hypothetical protein